MKAKVNKNELKRRKSVMSEQLLEEFRLELLALSEAQIYADLTIWINNLDPDECEEDASLLEQIATMLRVDIVRGKNGRRISFDNHLRERIAYLSLPDVDVLANLILMVVTLDTSAQRQFQEQRYCIPRLWDGLCAGYLKLRSAPLSIRRWIKYPTSRTM